jgi:hypothetical protein
MRLDEAAHRFPCVYWIIITTEDSETTAELCKNGKPATFGAKPWEDCVDEGRSMPEDLLFIKKAYHSIIWILGFQGKESSMSL